MKTTLKFILKAETPGALRYGELLPNNQVASRPNEPGAYIGTLYVRKSGFPTAPKELRVTVEHD